MDHKQAESSLAAERYLLGEMPAAERDLFEEHFFECPQCAEAVRGGEILRANLRKVAAEGDERSNVMPLGARRIFRPVWAVAAALMLTVLSYQNLFLLPQLRSRLAAAESPRVYDYSILRSAVRGDGDVVRVRPETRDVGLFVPVPGPADFQSYLVELKSGDVVQTSLRAPAPPAGLPIPILIPASKLVAGEHRLVLFGLSEGEPTEVDTFNFRIEK